MCGNNLNIFIIDLDPASLAFESKMLTFPITLQGGFKEYGYKNNVIAILQVILSPQSPSTELQPSLPPSQSPVPPPNPSLPTDDLFLKDSVSWFLHFLRPTLLQLMHSVNQTPLQIIAPTFVKTPDHNIYGKNILKYAYVYKILT
jgi:hypothetical protein